MMAHLIQFLLLMLSLAIFSTSSRLDRPFHFVAFASSAYFGFLGPIYWQFFHDNVFLQIDWTNRIDEAAYLILFGIILVQGTYWILARRTDSSLLIRLGAGRKSIELHDARQPDLTILWVFGAIGLMSALYVFSSIQRTGGGLNRSDPFILIAYQFSDICIPIILMLVARNGLGRLTVGAAVCFILYAVAVGFRYKLVLLLYPIIAALWLAPVDRGTAESRLSGRITALLLAFGTLALFSVMTLARSKFDGLDLSQAEGKTSLDFLFGLFAESNVLFGLAAVISDFGEHAPYQYFRPVIDIFLELVPRFIYPDRETGKYLEYAAMALLSDEGAKSGTAYPHVGEFYIMFGMLGVIVGCTLTGTIAFWFRQRILAYASAENPAVPIGMGLLGVMFCYYFASRGYLPQAAKAIFFVIAPYVICLNRLGRHSD